MPRAFIGVAANKTKVDLSWKSKPKMKGAAVLLVAFVVLFYLFGLNGRSWRDFTKGTTFLTSQN